MSTNAYESVFGSDIFNRRSKPLALEKAHKRNVFKIKTDVFNESKQEDDRKLRSRSNKSQSDIFFKVPNKGRPDQSYRRNVSNRSVVFSHLNSKDYVVNKQRNSKPYEPVKHNREISPVKRRLNELYSQDELNQSDMNASTCSLTSRGFLKKEEESFNPAKKLPASNRRKCFWQLEQEALDQEMMNKTASQVNKMEEMKSNIFNDSQKESFNTANKTADKTKLYANEAIPDTMPKKYHHSKWMSKLDWKNPKTEILFKSANDKEEEKMSAYQRKHNQLHGSVPSVNGLHRLKKEEFHKESIDSYISHKYRRHDQRKRLNDNVSCGFINNTFNEKTMQYSTNNPIEHEYLIKDGKGLEPKDIQKMFEKRGLQVYNILDDSSAIFGRTSYRFKIRENDKERFNQTFSEVCEVMKKERRVDIEPLNKITVNKKKPSEVQMPNDRLFPSEEVKRADRNNEAGSSQKTVGGTKYKKKFTPEFKAINNSYKNNGVKRFNGAY